ncbi:MAG: IclR family transcriptional regulator [Armatimonadota bacterium]|nr:IclR family transcriptional regulator [Armatimonadota bacterium]MDR7450896.1 IclR family transcriptional regulator [Armatimonadota bacterium]MDR7465818.1 IclR family transcriptional regulator [Armatimonadota bacterium]MDR7493726.1 IclR family transcriptional regulator [Armatimonadota bacterium]MDR7498332.1 IclR family transcriptional regulator [Armatimonadota bacterium]
MSRPHPRYLQSIRHALRILKLFAPDRALWGVTQAASALRLSKSTTSRVLATLAAEEFVQKDQSTGRYRLGVRAYEAGLAYLSGLNLREAAMPILEEVAFALRETVYLGILGDRAAIYIDKILSPLALRVDSYIGLAIPLHATALGKVLLAWQPEEYINSFIASGPRPFTRRTITGAATLRRELRTVRQRGYAVDLEEYEDGLHCIAFPIRDHRGAVAGAYSVSGPAVRLTRQTMHAHLPRLKNAALEISARLGFRARTRSGTPHRETVQPGDLETRRIE